MSPLSFRMSWLAFGFKEHHDWRHHGGTTSGMKRNGAESFVYILASKRNGTLYIGVTSDLVKRIWEHKQNVGEGFTSRYDVHALVYFEMHGDMAEAIRREKQLKKWKRSWKIELI